MTSEYSLKKNILFVLYNDFRSNSAMHVHNFANQLTLMGYDCAVSVPQNKDSADILQERLYSITEFSQIEQLPGCFYNGRGPDIVHAWTPREKVRIYCEALRERFDFALFIHLEDNEEHILEKYLGYLPTAQNWQQANISSELSHPIYYREFLNSAQGVTVIMERLKEFCPSHVPSVTIWPGVDITRFAPGPPEKELMAQLAITPETIVLCYTGNVHIANQEEVRSLYLAVGWLNLQGYSARLVRTGLDFCTFLNEEESWVKQYAIELGYVNHTLIPDLLNLAHALVQPGRAGSFNDYRFPSKLPEFLAMGKPVILPASNLGHYLISGEQALVLPTVEAADIVKAVQQICDNPDLPARLGEGARRFASQYLDWERNTEKLLGFYNEVGNFSECV